MSSSMQATRPDGRRSALYEGFVQHRRFGTEHRFRRRLRLVYLDLDEIDRLFAGRWLWSKRWWSPRRFCRSDYLGPPDVPLDQAVRAEALRLTGRRPDGRIGVLTALRSFGCAFHPVSFYYCHDRNGRLQTVLAEITNTPWRQRHCYAVTADGDDAPHRLAASFAKRFHVSPFLPMGLRYRWRLSAPGERLVVRMADLAGSRRVFDATLRLRRRPWTTANLWRTFLRDPFPAQRVLLAIYWQALRLWWKGALFHVHPQKRLGEQEA